MSVVDRARSLDALWQLREVLRSDGPGLGMPVRLLDGIRAVLPCDLVCFNAVDSVRRHHPLMQGVGEDGVAELEDPVPTDEDELFWRHYWTSDCSLPDRTGDLTTVRLQSDVLSQRQWHAHPFYVEGEPGARPEHEMMVVWPDGGPGRTLRLLCVRFSGPDFDDDDRFLLELLRPHLLRAYRAAAAERRRRVGTGVASLTPRQLEVLAVAAEGATNHAIGRALGISEGTVRTHLHNAYATLGVSSRAAAAALLTAAAPDLVRPR